MIYILKEIPLMSHMGQLYMTLYILIVSVFLKSYVQKKLEINKVILRLIRFLVYIIFNYGIITPIDNLTIIIVTGMDGIRVIINIPSK